MLEHDFRIGHATIQVEVEGCGVDNLHCEMWASRHKECGHSH
jgi:hypothetical protein